MGTPWPPEIEKEISHNFKLGQAVGFEHAANILLSKAKDAFGRDTGRSGDNDDEAKLLRRISKEFKEMGEKLRKESKEERDAK